jgi:hypothetical protein
MSEEQSKALAAQAAEVAETAAKKAEERALVSLAGSLVGMSVDDALKLARAAVASKAYKGLDSPTKALIKIRYGQEVGLLPMQSLQQIYIVNDVPSFSARFIAARIKASRPRYNYRVKERTNTKCVLEFWEDGEVAGLSEWTIEDAKRAGLLDKAGTPWKTYPRAMLFSRALTEGARVYCPDVIGLTIYTPEELGGEPAPEDVIDAEVIKGE